MTLLFQSNSWILSAGFYVSASVTVVLALLWFVRKKISHKELRKHHDVIGYVISLIGVLYSVLLGFIVIDVQNRYNEAEQIVHTEAMALSELYRDSMFFPNPEKSELRNSLKQYIQYVIQQEWRSDRSHKRHFEGQSKLDQIWRAYRSIEVPDLKTAASFSQGLHSLERLMNARLSRIFNSWAHLSDMMWSILLIGAFVTVSFMLFFNLENFQLQMLMTGILTGFLTFMLFLIYTLDHVYEGSEAIQPAAFQEVEASFEKWEKE